MIAEYTSNPIVLRPERRSPEVTEFENSLRSKIVGQEEAVSQLVNVYQTVLAGMNLPGRPMANLLFLGPTGSGKTRLVEAAAEILLGNEKAFIKVDCAEYQHGHEIAKLIGSPPGYIGHRETPAMLSQEAIDHFHTDKLKLTFILFDEIEKASDALWQLLLGILDKATLTLGDNRRVDFSRTIVVMTSNLGTTEMGRAISGGIGFAPRRSPESMAAGDPTIHRVAVDAAKRHFSPEFMNRLDKIVVFRTLMGEQLRQILEIELNEVQRRILSIPQQKVFMFQCTPKAKEFLLNKGTDRKYGARHLKRAIERYLVVPLASLMSTGQILDGDVVTVDAASEENALYFTKQPMATGVAGIPTSSEISGRGAGHSQRSRTAVSSN